MGVSHDLKTPLALIQGYGEAITGEWRLTHRGAAGRSGRRLTGPPPARHPATSRPPGKPITRSI